MALSKNTNARLKRVGRVTKYLGVGALGVLAFNLQYFLIFLVVLAPLLYWSEVQADLRDNDEKTRNQLAGVVHIDSNGIVVSTQNWNQADAEKVSQLREDLLRSLDNSNQISGNFRHLMSVVATEENRSREEFCQEVEGWFSHAMDVQSIRRHAYATQETILPFRFAFHHDGYIAPRNLQLTLDFPAGTEVWLDRADEDSLNAGMNTPDFYNRRRNRLISPVMHLDLFGVHTETSKSRFDVQLRTSEDGTTLVQTFSNVFVGNRCITHPFFVSTLSSTEQLIMRWTVTSSDLHGTVDGQLLLPPSQLP
jgi:hypothetical protein